MLDILNTPCLMVWSDTQSMEKMVQHNVSRTKFKHLESTLPVLALTQPLKEVVASKVLSSVEAKIQLNQI